MNKFAKLSIIILVILIVVGLVVFNRNVNKDPIRIGVASLLSGDFAVVGQNIVNSSKLAAKDINDKGGINGRQIELYVEDSGCSSKDGLSAVQKLIGIDKVKYIIGGMCSNGTMAAAPLANQNHVLIMTPVTGGNNIDNAGEYIFRNANADVLAGRDLANTMIDMGYKNVGVIAEVTEYTLDIKKSFEQTIKERNGTIVVAEEFQSNTKDYRTLIGKMRTSKPDAILVLSQLGTNAAQFIKQSRELGFNPKIFTDFTLATNDNAKKVAGSFDGIYFADPSYDSSSDQAKMFFDQYRKTYGMISPIPFHAAASYDAVMMYANAIKVVGDDPEKVKDWLLNNIKDYKGLMGNFSFDAKGNSNLGFTVKVIRNGKPELVELRS